MEKITEIEDIDLNELGLTMQFVFLTVPPEDEVDKMALHTNTRTYSVCSASSLQTPLDEDPPPIVMTEAPE